MSNYLCKLCNTNIEASEFNKHLQYKHKTHKVRYLHEQEHVDIVEVYKRNGSLLNPTAEELSCNPGTLRKFLNKLFQDTSSNRPVLLWEKENNKSISDLYKSGMSILKMSQLIGCSRGHITNILEERGIYNGYETKASAWDRSNKASIRKLYEQYESSTIVARIVGVSHRDILKHLNKSNISTKRRNIGETWENESGRRIDQLYLEGYSLNEIMDIAGFKSYRG